MNAIITALIAVTAFIALLFMIVYATFGRPWAEFFGRAMMALQGAIFLVLLYATQHRLIYPAPIVPSQFVPALLAYLTIATVEFTLLAALWQLLVKRRGGPRASRKSRRIRKQALASADPMYTLIAGLDLLDDREFELVMASTRPR